jgi:hypothetical protein
MKKIQILEGKRPIVGEQNINYIDFYSVKFRRTDSGSMTFSNQVVVLQPHTFLAPAPSTPLYQ